MTQSAVEPVFRARFHSITELNRVLAFALATGILLSIAAYHPQALALAGTMLVEDDPLEKSDVALVLGGEEIDGTRTRTALDLYRRGFVKKVVLSGPPSGDIHESSVTGSLAIAMGMPASDLIVLDHQATSTFDEANALVPMMLHSGIHSVIVVTSNFHTRRARNYFESASQGRLHLLVRAAPGVFEPESWWTSTTGVAIFSGELAKTVLSWVRIAMHQPGSNNLNPASL